MHLSSHMAANVGPRAHFFVVFVVCCLFVWFGLVWFGLVWFVCLFVCAKIHALYPHHCALHDTVKHSDCLAQAGLKDVAQVTE